MSQPTFRTYPGKNDIEKAQHYLLATQPGFKGFTRYEQIRLAGDHVKQCSASKGSLDQAISDDRKKSSGVTDGGKVDALRALLESENFCTLLDGALNEDATGTGKLFDSVTARVTAKRAAASPTQGVVAASAAYATYPGRNEIEQARAFLCDKLPGFKGHEFQKQIRLASEYVRTLARSGAAEADRVLMARLGAA